MFTLIVVCFCIILVLLCAVQTTTNLKLNLISYGRVTIELSIGLLLLVSNYGHEWEHGTLKTKTPYKPGCGKTINASIGIHIGIRGLATTYNPVGPFTDCLKYEVVEYRKDEWKWTLGNWDADSDNTKAVRKYSLEDQIKNARHLGVPKPVIWVAEHFLSQEGEFELFKLYRLLGWSCEICLWCAFFCYLCALLLFQFTIKIGVYYLGACGLLQLVPNLLWFLVRNVSKVDIYFENGHLRSNFGFNYWLNFCCGILCLALSVGITIMEYRFEKALYMLLGTDPLNRFDEVIYLSKQECKNLHNTHNADSIPLASMGEANSEDEGEYFVIYSKNPMNQDHMEKFLRKNKSVEV